MAEPLWLCIEEIESELHEAKHLWLGLDYDGTLAPLVVTPDRALLGTEVRATLSALCRQECIEIAIISGRALPDIRAKVNLEGITIAGNHGMQIEGNGIEYRDAAAHALSPSMKEVESLLREKLKAIPGVVVESKGLSLTVHFRLANPNDSALIESLVNTVIATQPTLRVRKGAKILEILPVSGADKGSAVRMLLETYATRDSLPIYIGDDLTDEDAFKAIPNGITVHVGANRATSARYRVATPAVVHQFLIWLLNFVSK